MIVNGEPIIQYVACDLGKPPSAAQAARGLLYRRCKQCAVVCYYHYAQRAWIHVEPAK